MKQQGQFTQLALSFDSLLRLKREIVGIKFLRNRLEISEFSGKIPVKKLAFCNAVYGASMGREIILTKEMGGCNGSNRALGFNEVNESFYSGIAGRSLGLYKDRNVAATVARDSKITDYGTEAVVIKPLAKLEKSPDVILLFLNVREAMRVLQGYTFNIGIAKNITFTGNQALCVEATVTPMMTNDINVSLLCSGTRYRARWGEDEVVIGFPFSMAEALVEGIKSTVNAVEGDARKKEIETNLSNQGMLDFEIEYGRTYYADGNK